MEIPFNFCGGAYLDRSKNVNNQECVNLYPIVDQQGGKVISLYPCPGLKAWCDPGHFAEVRGCVVVIPKNQLYVVIGDRVYSIGPSGSYTQMTGTLDTSVGRVDMAYNTGFQIIIVDVEGDAGYSLIGTTVSKITDADFVKPSGVTWQDGYFIVPEKLTQRYWLSGINDITSWDALDYGTAEGLPDDIKAAFSDHREAWMFGDVSTEVFINTGNPDFPFERLEGSFQEVGIGAAATPAKGDNSIWWLDNWYHVRRADAYTPQIVSTPQIAWQIEQYATKDDAFAFFYEHEGHAFYVLTFPTADRTWAYDPSTGFWHRRSSYPNAPDGRWRANCYAHFAGKHLVGDYQNGIIYELDHDTYTDNDEVLPAVRTCQALDSQGRNVAFHSLEVFIEAGVGLVTGQGSDPMAILQWSNDNGTTWGNEHWRSMGKIGETTKRVKWNRLGAGRNRAFKLTITDPVNRVITGARLQGTIGKS